MTEKIIQLRDIDTGDKIYPKTFKEGILDLEIDQTFNSTSENPQSGVAISNALSTVAFTGNYADLLNKPDAQIQSNWNDTDTESPAYIQNKPDVPNAFWITYGITTYDEITDALAAGKLVMCNYGSSAYSYYTKDSEDSYIFTLIGKNGTELLCSYIICTIENSWDIGSMNASYSQVQANWNDTDTESPAYIQNKPVIPDAQIQSNWNSTDTESPAFIQNKPNLALKEDVNKALTPLATSGTIELVVNTAGSTTPLSAISFTLPTITDNTKLYQIYVQLKLDTVVAINTGIINDDKHWLGDKPDLSVAGLYDIIWVYNTIVQEWFCGVVPAGN